MDALKKARGDRASELQALRMKNGRDPAQTGAQPLAALKFK